MNDVRAASWWAITTSVRSALRSPVTATTFVVVRRRETSRRVMYGPSAISSAIPSAAVSASAVPSPRLPRRVSTPAATPRTFSANSGFQKSPYAGSTSTCTSQPCERIRSAIQSAARASPSDADGRSMAASVSTTSRSSSANCVDDLIRERRVLLQVLHALGLQRLDDLGVVVAPPGRLVQLLRPQHGG